MRATITRLAALALSLALGSCILFAPEPGIGKRVDWDALEGWRQDRHAQAWPALLHSCARLEDREAWKELCAAAQAQGQPDDARARAFFETWFAPFPVHAERGEREGLITGYYEPLLNGSYEPSDRFRFPIYGRPEDLLIIDLAELYPELKGKRLRGKVKGRKVVPYYSRAELDRDPHLLSGNEILWVDDAVALFFLHIQGSGRVRMPDGRIIGVGYADQNGHPYRAIGRYLIESGALSRDQVSMFTIRDWLRENREQATDLLHRNPSYVFFQLRENPGDGPIGSLNVPLTAERSIAVDRDVIPLGTPIWLDTTTPKAQPYRRLVMAQDTGGAIAGFVRADLFWGHGQHAEEMAGNMKQPGRLYALLPKAATCEMKRC